MLVFNYISAFEPQYTCLGIKIYGFDLNGQRSPNSVARGRPCGRFRLYFTNSRRGDRVPLSNEVVSVPHILRFIWYKCDDPTKRNNTFQNDGPRK